jgi:hypothetical protein
MGPPSRRVTARTIAHLAGPAPCALCRCDIFPLHVKKDAEAKPRSWEDGLGRIRQLFNRMGRGTPTPAADQKSRFMNEMTMDEIWQLGEAERPDWDPRI